MTSIKIILVMFLLLPSFVFGQDKVKSQSSVLKMFSGNEGVDNKRYLTVEVGDSTKSDYTPCIRLSAWSGECTFNVDLRSDDLPTVADASPSVDSANGKPRVSLSGDNVSHNIYATSSGCLEWEIVLDSNIGENSFTFDISGDGVNIYQMPDNSDGVGMSDGDSLDGMYILKHSSKRNSWTDAEGKRHEYKSSVMGCIYRPYLVDSHKTKRKRWCNMIVNDSQMIVTAPATFLSDTAVFPVTIDPTFGNTTAGALSENQYDFTLSFFDNYYVSDGTEVLDSVCIHFLDPFSVTQEINGYVLAVTDMLVDDYSYYDGGPDSLQISDSGWFCVPVTASLVNGNSYAPAFRQEEGGGMYPTYTTVTDAGVSNVDTGALDTCLSFSRRANQATDADWDVYFIYHIAAATKPQVIMIN